LGFADLPSRTLVAGELLQHVSRTRYRGTALHFGREGKNRYDDRHDDPTRRFGVLYLAFDLATGLMESVFHAHDWHRSRRRSITNSEVTLRLVRAVGVVKDLHLADLTAPGVMAAELGLNLSQLSSRRYGHTQRIAAGVHAALGDDGLPRFDGVLYPSRNNHPAACVALFDRAADKVELVDDIDLIEHRDWPGFVRTFKIGVMPV